MMTTTERMCAMGASQTGRKRLQRRGCLAALLALTVAAGSAAAADAPPAPPSMAAVVDALGAAGFRGTILSGDTERLRFSRAIGLAQLDSKRPIDLGDVWPWASVTKQITAVLVMQEVEQGKMGLDQPLSRYLPGFKGPTGGAITIRQLLRHTSGLPNPNDTGSDPTQMPPFYVETGAGTSQQARALGYCAGTPKAAPGAAFEYNNCDYLVLGAVLEKVTGVSYRELVRRRIALPQQLRSVDVFQDPAMSGAEAIRGYDDASTPSPAANIATLGAAGAMRGTAGDLFALDQALLKGKLLGPAATAEMHQGDPKAGYAALGVWAFPARLAGCARPVQLVERRGDFDGIQVRNLLAPELGLALVVFTNHGSFDFGELWQGKGAGFDLASAAFCGRN
jgi:CubicO group peptidase (beta-lactamase class C family)